LRQIATSRAVIEPIEHSSHRGRILFRKILRSSRPCVSRRPTPASTTAPTPAAASGHRPDQSSDLVACRIPCPRCSSQRPARRRVSPGP
jgi:hypothetical protein